MNTIDIGRLLFLALCFALLLPEDSLRAANIELEKVVPSEEVRQYNPLFFSEGTN